MKKKTLELLIAISMIAITAIYPQEVKVTDAGSFSGSINGKEFTAPIRFGESDNTVSIATGNENFTLTLNWEKISSLSEIKTGTYKLPATDNNPTILYLDNNAGMPSIVTNGKLSITENNEQVLIGTLEFTAATGGIPKEMGGTENKFTNGSFEISKKK